MHVIWVAQTKTKTLIYLYPPLTHLIRLGPQFQSAPLLRTCLIVLVSYWIMVLPSSDVGSLLAPCLEPAIKNYLIAYLGSFLPLKESIKKVPKYLTNNKNGL